MFESHKTPLLPKSAFLARLSRSIGVGLSLILVSLGIGVMGYHYFEKMSWVDAFVNAAMILSGMGPLTELRTVSGKLFAGVYALFSGLALLVIIAVILAPVIHRFLHRFHLEEDRNSRKK